MFMAATALAAAQEIGTVISYTPGATLLRDGKAEPLAPSAGIRLSDTVQTDSAGRVKILFNDDSSISLGPNTVMDMSEYADAGSKSSFAVHVGQGMVRAITGKIVDQNPGGFRMSSPEATVGIRGTIVTMHVEKGQDGKHITTVYVESALRRVYANNENVPSGSKWILSGGVSKQERITPDDRRHIGKELAFRGGAGSVAAAPEVGEGGQPAATEQLLAAGGSLGLQGALNSDDKVAQDLILANLAQSLLTENLQVAPTPTTGYVSGGWTTPAAGWTLDRVDFSFYVNLSDGTISNGRLIHEGTMTGAPVAAQGYYQAELFGGTGQAYQAGWYMELDGYGTVQLTSGQYTVPVSGELDNIPLNLHTVSTGSPIDDVGWYVWYDLTSTPVNNSIVSSSTGAGTITHQ